MTPRVRRYLRAGTAGGALSLVAAALAVLPTVPGAPALAAAPSNELFVIAERTVTVPAPAPGASEPWGFEVASASDDSHDVIVRVSAAEGPLFSGTDPAEVSLGLAGEAPVLAGRAAELVSDTHVSLGALPGVGALRIAGEVRLPRSAGNEYQGASGVLTLQIAATRDTGDPKKPGPPKPGAPTAQTGRTADSGAVAPWQIAAIAALLTAAGGALVARRVGRSRTEMKARDS